MLWRIFIISCKFRRKKAVEILVNEAKRLEARVNLKRRIKGQTQ